MKLKLNPRTMRYFKRWFDWYYETHVRTPERFSMLFNHKTHEIFEDMVADEIIRRVVSESPEERRERMEIQWRRLRPDPEE